MFHLSLFIVTLRAVKKRSEAERAPKGIKTKKAVPAMVGDSVLDPKVILNSSVGMMYS
jgi:hypothetical protein